MTKQEKTGSKNQSQDKSNEKEQVKPIDKLVKELEQLRGTRVLTLLFSYDQSINDGTVGKVYSKLRENFEGTKKLDVIIHSSGGNIDAAYGLSQVLRSYAPEKLTFIIPRWAKSAATLLVCSGDEIVMGVTSELGPLDPQIYTPDPITGSEEVFSPLSIKSTLEILKELSKENYTELCEVITKKMNPYTLGEFIHSLDIAKEYEKKLLSSRMFKNGKEAEQKINDIAEKLATGYVHHGYFISSEEAKGMGLKVIDPSPDQWEILWKIQDLFLESEEDKLKKEAEVFKKESKK